MKTFLILLVSSLVWSLSESFVHLPSTQLFTNSPPAFNPRSGPHHPTALSANVKLNFPSKTVSVPEGSAMKSACSKAGFKPKYSCKKGDCGSCTVTVGGARVKCCIGKVPPAPKLKSIAEKGLNVR